MKVLAGQSSAVVFGYLFAEAGRTLWDHTLGKLFDGAVPGQGIVLMTRPRLSRARRWIGHLLAMVLAVGACAPASSQGFTIDVFSWDAPGVQEAYLDSPTATVAAAPLVTITVGDVSSFTRVDIPWNARHEFTLKNPEVANLLIAATTEHAVFRVVVGHAVVWGTVERGYRAAAPTRPEIHSGVDATDPFVLIAGGAEIAGVELGTALQLIWRSHRFGIF